eukprot:Clim_evm35s229 gene=Clim_evmTU35s229
MATTVRQRKQVASKAASDPPADADDTGDSVGGLSVGGIALRVGCGVIVGVLAVSGFVLALLVLRNGGPGGIDFPLSIPGERMDAKEEGVLKSTMEIYATLQDSPPGNIAAAANGRVFYTYHPEFESKAPAKVAEWIEEAGHWVPFPDAKWQTDKFVSVLSVRVDQQNRLWCLDFAQHGILGTPHIYAFDVSGPAGSGGELVHTYTFPATVASFGSMLNDFAVEPKGRYIYIADTSVVSGNPAIVTYDTHEKRSWRCLEGHPSVRAELYLPKVNDRPVKLDILGDLMPIRPHVDSIVLDAKGEYLYYGPVAHERLFRIHASSLQNQGHCSSREVSYDIEDYAAKTISDGLSIDDANNIYVTSFEHDRIDVILSKDRTLLTLVRDPELIRWPDGLSFGKDGWLYFTSSCIHFSFWGDEISTKGPFHILRIKPDVLKAKYGLTSRPAGQ